MKRYGYTTVDAFMQVYRATKKVKDSYEKKLATWNNKYGQHAESKAKPRKSIKESLKENKKKVSEEKKERKEKIVLSNIIRMNKELEMTFLCEEDFVAIL